MTKLYIKKRYGGILAKDFFVPAYYSDFLFCSLDCAQPLLRLVLLDLGSASPNKGSYSTRPGLQPQPTSYDQYRASVDAKLLEAASSFPRLLRNYTICLDKLLPGEILQRHLTQICDSNCFSSSRRSCWKQAAQSHDCLLKTALSSLHCGGFSNKKDNNSANQNPKLEHDWTGWKRSRFYNSHSFIIVVKKS